MSPISGQNCFCCGKISDKDPFPVIFFIFRVACNLHFCRTSINVSTKGNFPVPANSVSRYHAIVIFRVARNLHFCHTRMNVPCQQNKRKHSRSRALKVCHDITLGSHAICISVIHASMCQQKETFPLPLKCVMISRYSSVALSHN